MKIVSLYGIGIEWSGMRNVFCGFGNCIFMYLGGVCVEVVDGMI